MFSANLYNSCLLEIIQAFVDSLVLEIDKMQLVVVYSLQQKGRYILSIIQKMIEVSPKRLLKVLVRARSIRTNPSHSLTFFKMRLG